MVVAERGGRGGGARQGRAATTKGGQHGGTRQQSAAADAAARDGSRGLDLPQRHLIQQGRSNARLVGATSSTASDARGVDQDDGVRAGDGFSRDANTRGRQRAV